MLSKLQKLRAGAALALLLAAGSNALAGGSNDVFIARAEKALAFAQQKIQAATNDSAAALQLARATFDLADLATNDTRKAEFARLGIAACRQMIAREPKSAPAHYFLAMNLGKLAEAEAPSLAAYRLIHEIESEFKTAAELDVRYDFAGPARCLGLLYRDAPGWPVSIGSNHKAREWLERAESLAPEFPENPLNLAETHLQWRQRAETEKALNQLEAVWPAARTNLVDEARERDWRDWIGRRETVRAEYNRVFKIKTGK